MNSPLRDESDDPARDGAEELDSANAESEPAEGADASAAAESESGEADGATDSDEATGNDAESASADEASAASDGDPDLNLVEGAGAPEGVRPVEFAQIGESSADGNSGSIEMLMDIKLPISVELGRTETFVRDILEYGTGSVIELDKLAGDPVDVLVNGRLVAKGEVVVVDDHFGVRITLLLTPEERVRSLG